MSRDYTGWHIHRKIHFVNKAGKLEQTKIAGMIGLYRSIVCNTCLIFAGYPLLMRMDMHRFDQHKQQENSEQETPVAYPGLYMVQYPHLSKIGGFFNLQQRCNKYFPGLAPLHKKSFPHITDKANIWEINTDDEYHEESGSAN